MRRDKAIACGNAIHTREAINQAAADRIPEARSSISKRYDVTVIEAEFSASVISGEGGSRG
jgi:hypothetical protein